MPLPDWSRETTGSAETADTVDTVEATDTSDSTGRNSCVVGLLLRPLPAFPA